MKLQKKGHVNLVKGNKIFSIDSEGNACLLIHGQNNMEMEKLLVSHETGSEKVSDTLVWLEYKDG